MDSAEGDTGGTSKSKVEYSEQLEKVRNIQRLRKDFCLAQRGAFKARDLINDDALGSLDEIRKLALHVGVNGVGGENLETLLVLACRKGKADVVRTLLDSKADVDIIDRKECTALHWAVYQGDFRICDMLLGANAELNKSDSKGFTPLLVASQQGHTDLLRRLLEQNADPLACSNDHATALHIASAYGRAGVIEVLLDSGVPLQAQEATGASALFLACKHGHAHVAELLLEHSASVNMECNNGLTPIMASSKGGYEFISRLLIDRGASIDQQDKTGRTSLHMAASAGHVDVCKYLISAGANLEIKEFQNENTSLHLAADAGSRETMSLLLAAGASVDPCNAQNVTPLMFAARGGFSTAVRVLLDNGANVVLHDQSSRGALEYGSDHDSVMGLLLSEISAKEPGVRLESPDKSGSDTTSSRGGASSNGSVNADIIDLSPQVAHFLDVLGYSRYNDQLASEFESVLAITQSWKEQEFKLFAEEYGPMKKHHAKRILAEAHKSVLRRAAYPSTATSESSVKSLTLHELRRLQGVIQRFLMRVDPDLSTASDSELEADDNLRQAIDNLFAAGKITENQQKCLHTLRSGRNYIRNGTKEYFRNPNIHISEGIQQALDYLGVPRSEISDRDQFQEIIPVGMAYEWCTE